MYQYLTLCILFSPMLKVKKISIGLLVLGALRKYFVQWCCSIIMVLCQELKVPLGLHYSGKHQICRIPLSNIKKTPTQRHFKKSSSTSSKRKCQFYSIKIICWQKKFFSNIHPFSFVFVPIFNDCTSGITYLLWSLQKMGCAIVNSLVINHSTACIAKTCILRHSKRKQFLKSNSHKSHMILF